MTKNKREYRRLQNLFPRCIKNGKLNPENVHWITFGEIKSEVEKAKERNNSSVTLKGCMTIETELKCRFLIRGLLLSSFKYYIYAPLLCHDDAWLDIDF